jgi:urea transport system ATP-binding protein
VFEQLTVFENLELALKTGKGVAASMLFKLNGEQKDRLSEVLHTIHLDSDLLRQAGNLSHGQKQWLEIGMLLMQDPELLMLDEPIAGMSVRERELTAELLNRICKGRSMIVIEHDMNFVKQIAHKVTVMHQGKILAEGAMEDVQADPRVIDVYLGH